MADAATAAPPATDTMDPGALLASMREDRSRAQGEADTALARARAAEQKMLEAAPAVQPTPPEQQWGSMAMAVAALGGLLTHTPVTTAANAMAGVLNAYKANDVAKAQQSYEQWKAAHDAALKMADLEVKAYDDAIKEKASDPRGYQATMLALTSSFKNEGAARAAEAGNWTLMEQIVGGLKSRVDKLGEAGGEFEGIHAQNMAMGEVADGQIADQEKALGRKLTKAEKAQIYLDVRSSEAAKGAGEKKETIDKGTAISDDAANLAADRVLSGDERATVGLARSSANITKVTNAIVKLAQDRGMSGADIAAKIAEFQGTTAGERTLGTRAANMEVAANEVANMAPLALAASKSVNRSEFPSLNKVLIAAEKGTGDPQVVQFGLAANSLIYTYAKFLNPTGIPTDADKARATDILSTAWTNGQFEAAIAQIRREIESGRAAIGTTRDEFRESLGSGKAPGTVAPPAAQPAVAGGIRPASPEAVANLKQHPETRAEFDAWYGPGAAKAVLGQ